MSSNAVLIQTFSNRTAADLAAARLEAEGIACLVISDDAGGAYPMLDLTRGVRLFVAPEEEARAREILPSEDGDGSDPEVLDS